MSTTSPTRKSRNLKRSSWAPGDDTAALSTSKNRYPSPEYTPSPSPAPSTTHSSRYSYHSDSVSSQHHHHRPAQPVHPNNHHLKNHLHGHGHRNGHASTGEERTGSPPPPRRTKSIYKSPFANFDSTDPGPGSDLEGVVDERGSGHGHGHGGQERRGKFSYICRSSKIMAIDQSIDHRPPFFVLCGWPCWRAWAIACCCWLLKSCGYRQAKPPFRICICMCLPFLFSPPSSFPGCSLEEVAHTRKDKPKIKTDQRQDHGKITDRSYAPYAPKLRLGTLLSPSPSAKCKVSLR